MLRKLAGLAFLVLVLAPDPARALIGDTPTIRRVALCPSDGAGPGRGGIALLGQDPDGSFALIVRTFDRDTGGQTGSTLSVPIPRGTLPVELIFSTAFDPGHVLVLDAALTVHSFGIAFDADGTPKLIGDVPTIHGPFGDPALVGKGTALAEAPGLTEGDPYLAIGTAGGRMILVQPGAAPPRTDRIAAGPIQDLGAVPQVGYLAFLAVADGRLLGVNPDTDPGTPGPQPALRFTCIPPLGWSLRDIGTQPLDPGHPLPQPAPVRFAASNGSPLVAVLEIPANPTLGSQLSARASELASERIARVSVGYIEQDNLLEEEGIALLGAAGAGVSYDPGFRLAGGFTAADLTLVGATTQCVYKLAGPFVTAVIEVENGFAPQVDWATLVLTAGASSVPPSPDSTPQLGDTDGDGNSDLTVEFDRADVLQMLVGERARDVLAAWRFSDDSYGRASARVRLVLY